MRYSQFFVLFAFMIASCSTEDKMERKGKDKKDIAVKNDNNAEKASEIADSTNNENLSSAPESSTSGSNSNPETNNQPAKNNEQEVEEKEKTSGTTTNEPVPAKDELATNIVLSGGFYHYCAVSAGGKLYCWGSNQHSALGIGAEGNQTRPIRVGNSSDWTSVSAGTNHTCGIRAGKLFCWGSNAQGQIGKGDAVTGERIVTPLQIGSESNWDSVSAGQWHTCALNKTGELFCWGTNYHGQLGDGTQVSKYRPSKVNSDKDWLLVRVTTYSHSSCGLKKSGKLYCWGSPYKHAATSPILLPELVSTKTWKAMAIDQFSVCSIDDSSDLYCWGNSNSYNKFFKIEAPQKVSVAEKWRDVQFGSYSALAIKDDGTLFCWGYNFRGACGLGHEDQVAEPKKVGDDKWMKLEGALYSSCGLKADSSLWCSGTVDGITNKSTTFTKLEIDLTN